eukprot:COSAG05_NODE_132_length_17128_cov_54.447355_2_plen_318_part_00
MAHALPPLRTSGSKHGHLAALLAAQPRTRDPRDGVEKVLREQIALASQSANRRVERITRVEAILPARQTDDVHLSDWGDGEQLGGDPVPFDEDDDCVERISFDPQSHLLQLDAGLSALAATAPKPLLPFSQSPPDTRPENPCEVRAANPHAIDDSRTISDSRARFIKYDKDKDGELSKREVAKLFRDMEMEIDEHTMEVVLGEFDADNSGTIDYREFCKLCLYLNVGTQESAEAKRKLQAETARVEQSIPQYLKYLGHNHMQVAEMCEYCAALMHRQGRLTASLEMAEQAQKIRRQIKAECGAVLPTTTARKFVDDD